MRREAPEGGARTAVILVTVAAIAVLPYLGALGNQFLAWDDTIIILGQPFLREATAENLLTIVSPVPAREEWLPVRDLTLLLNFTLFGEGPFSFIAVNILLHAASSIAAFFLFRHLGASVAAAFVGAALFACHAVHVESVTWLSGRKDPLSALFLVTALIAHIRYREGRGRWWTPLVLLAPALLSKASCFIFPLWTASYDLFHGRELTLRARLLPLIPQAALSGAVIVTFLVLIREDGVIESYPPGGLPAVLLTNVALLADYTFHAILPLRHQAIYEVEFLRTAWSIRFLSSVLVLAAVAAICWRLRRRPWVPFACTLFYSSFIPYLNIVPHGIYYAERYLYLPTIASSLAAAVPAAALLGSRMRARALRLAGAGALACVMAIHGAAVFERNTAWADSETFWRHQARALPGNPAPLMNLGETHELAGRDPDAARVYASVLERFGETPEALYRLARIARRQGNLEAAMAIYEKHASISPHDPRPLNNLAELHRALGNPARAIAACERAIRTAPRYLLARANLARLLDETGRSAEAREHDRFIVENANLLPDEALVREARARLDGAAAR